MHQQLTVKVCVFCMAHHFLQKCITVKRNHKLMDMIRVFSQEAIANGIETKALTVNSGKCFSSDSSPPSRRVLIDVLRTREKTSI